MYETVAHRSRREKSTSPEIPRRFLLGIRSYACLWLGVLLLLLASHILVAQSAMLAPSPHTIPSSPAAVVAHAKPAVVNISAQALGERHAIVPRFPITGPFGDELAETPNQLATLIAQSPVGHRATLFLLHNRKEQVLTVTVAQKPEPIAQAKVRAKLDLSWGLTVTELTEDADQFLPFDLEPTGVLVVDIDPGSPAELGGIKVGDVVEEVNRQPIASVQDFIAAIDTAAEAPSLLLLIQRGAIGSFVILHAP